MGWHITLLAKMRGLLLPANIAHGLVVFVRARLAVFILRIIRLRYEQGFRNRPDPAGHHITKHLVAGHGNVGSAYAMTLAEVQLRLKNVSRRSPRPERKERTLEPSLPERYSAAAKC